MIGIDTKLDIFQSKEKPVRCKVLGSDGKERYFLLKKESDVETRVEENTMDIINFFNSILRKKLQI